MPSIQVFVRIRPILKQEIDSYQEEQRRFNVSSDKKQISIQIGSKREKNFRFDRIFGMQVTQQMFYQNINLQNMTEKVLDGYHSTIFAYGQTGSGKTYTIEGPNQDPGLIPRIFSDLFGRLTQRNNVQRSYKVMMSFVQIYNEAVYDLIDCTGKSLKIRWNKHQQFLVENLFEAQCRSKQDAVKWWKKGQKNKIMGSHKINNTSSRSHCLLTLKVFSYDLQDPSDTIQSKFEIVDLAGSERHKTTKSTGAVFKEGIEINKSLFTLRQVIASLYQISQGENPNKHIPYRDSKLTSLLKQSIGGNTFCSMIACLNPTSTHFQQSLQTLTYASMASFISNVPIKNVDPKIRENQQLKQQNDQYRKQIKKMSDHIQHLTKLLESAICVKCQNSQIQSEQSSYYRKTTLSEKKQKEQMSEPSGILKLPKFEKNLANDSEQGKYQLIQQPNKNQTNYQQIQVPKAQKKTLKTTKDILQSITMIKQLITANSSLRQKIESFKGIHEKQEKEIFNLMKENQVLRNRWDMMNDAMVIDEGQAPIVAYQKLIKEESINRSIKQNSIKQPRMHSQSSQKAKSTTYNYFLKKNLQTNQNMKSNRKRNISLRRPTKNSYASDSFAGF